MRSIGKQASGWLSVLIGWQRQRQKAEAEEGAERQRKAADGRSEAATHALQFDLLQLTANTNTNVCIAIPPTGATHFNTQCKICKYIHCIITIPTATHEILYILQILSTMCDVYIHVAIKLIQSSVL